MRLGTIKANGLAHSSYFLWDNGEAVVIDPRRDCSTYIARADRACVRIKYILETHCNEDYVIGSLDLQKRTNAEIAHSKATDFGYGEHALIEGDTCYIGNLKIEALHTPGHTNDSMSYVVYERLHENVPLMVFTGDTLFAGDVGRTDLLGEGAKRAQSERLYHSIFEKLLPLNDHVLVYPAHGAGSVCGHHMGVREWSTIGYERKMNRLLRLDETHFIRYLTTQQLPLPPYFQRARKLNTEGPPPASQQLRALETDEFEKLVNRRDATIIDTREPAAFAGSHIPGSLSIWLDGMSFFPGWVLADDEAIALVSERQTDAYTACIYLSRLGFDNVVGYLCRGIKDWRDRGKPFAHLKTCSVEQLKKAVDAGIINVLDVRQDTEWKQGHIKGAENIFVGYLKERSTDVPLDKPLAVHCSWGGRASLAASILLNLGYSSVYNVLGAIRAWKSSGYPLESA